MRGGCTEPEKASPGAVGQSQSRSRQGRRWAAGMVMFPGLLGSCWAPFGGERPELAAWREGLPGAGVYGRQEAAPSSLQPKRGLAGAPRELRKNTAEIRCAQPPRTTPSPNADPPLQSFCCVPSAPAPVPRGSNRPPRSATAPMEGPARGSATPARMLHGARVGGGSLAGRGRSKGVPPGTRRYVAGVRGGGGHPGFGVSLPSREAPLHGAPRRTQRRGVRSESGRRGPRGVEPAHLPPPTSWCRGRAPKFRRARSPRRPEARAETWKRPGSWYLASTRRAGSGEDRSGARGAGRGARGADVAGPGRAGPGRGWGRVRGAVDPRGDLPRVPLSARRALTQARARPPPF